MAHSIFFGEFYRYNNRGLSINTWDDWHLIPATKHIIAPPEVYTNYVDIPGAHGKYDLSEYLTGEPVYKNRSGSLQFFMAPGYGFLMETCNQIMNMLHGKRSQMILDDEPQYVYSGRFLVSPPQSDASSGRMTIGINYELDPFKFILPRNSLDEYWDIFLLDDLHSFKIMEKLNAAGSPYLVFPGYTGGYKLDGFISDSSTFPASVTVTADGIPTTFTRANINSPTVGSGTGISMTHSSNRVDITGTGLIDLVLWGGQL